MGVVSELLGAIEVDVRLQVASDVDVSAYFALSCRQSCNPRTEGNYTLARFRHECETLISLNCYRSQANDSNNIIENESARYNWLNDVNFVTQLSFSQ